jgi:hypothetical protein
MVSFEVQAFHVAWTSFFQLIFFLQFSAIKTLDPDPKLDPDSFEMLDLDWDFVNPDPQHCIKV